MVIQQMQPMIEQSINKATTEVKNEFVNEIGKLKLKNSTLTTSDKGEITEQKETPPRTLRAEKKKFWQRKNR